MSRGFSPLRECEQLWRAFLTVCCLPLGAIGEGLFALKFAPAHDASTAYRRADATVKINHDPHRFELPSSYR